MWFLKVVIMQMLDEEIITFNSHLHDKNAATLPPAPHHRSIDEPALQGFFAFVRTHDNSGISEVLLVKSWQGMW